MLDGIDECDENETVVADIIRVTQNSRVKLLLFSRPSVITLSHAVCTEHRFDIQNLTGADIRTFLTSMLYANRNLFPNGGNISELANRLVFGADGMFLWARLMIDYLKLPLHSPSKRVRIINNVTMPEKNQRHVRADISTYTTASRSILATTSQVGFLRG